MGAPEGISGVCYFPKMAITSRPFAIVIKALAFRSEWLVSA